MVRLGDILKIQSTSGEWQEMRKHITKTASKIPNVKLEWDKKGNLYATKGDSDTYAAFVCHIDTVHDIVDGYEIGRMPKSHVWFGFIEKDNKFFETGIGGDDKCGIYLCLKMLEYAPAVKCVFYVDEEIGCIGSLNSDVSFFDNCRYVVQCDRKGNSDIVTQGSGVRLCSKEFEADVAAIGLKHGYEPSFGGSTDVVTLKEKLGLAISAINISVGYYNPHQDSERIVEKDLMKALEFCRNIYENLKEVYPHKYVAIKPSFN